MDTGALQLRLRPRAAAAMLLVLLLVLVAAATGADVAADYYERLGVARDATTRELRIAFRKLALTEHPDKNTGDPAAHDRFVAINTAFEVLKDPATRKKYDMYGEEGLKDDGNRGGQYQGWNYYKEDFGLYDSDPQITTFDSESFFDEAVNSPAVWFVNFYSPGCSHCHDLAPDWRQLGLDFEGVIGIGAVNCQDNWIVCRQMGIRSYPQLRLFTTPQQYKPYQSQRSLEAMSEFILNHFPEVPFANTDRAIRTIRRQGANRIGRDAPVPLLLVVCQPAASSCPEQAELKKVASMVGGTSMLVAQLDCNIEPAFCATKGFDQSHARLILASEDVSGESIYPPRGDDWDDVFSPQSLGRTAIASLPGPPALTEEDLLGQLVSDISGDYRLHPEVSEGAAVVFFVTEHCPECVQLAVEVRKMSLDPELARSAIVNCTGSQSPLCHNHVHHFPTLVLYKEQGHEVFHGSFKANVLDEWLVAGLRSNVVTLSAATFDAAVADPQQDWFVDFFAPWCPPCRKMLPAFRLASQELPDVRFGTVDCTVHHQLCNRMGIQSYPYPVFYNGSTPHQHNGDTSSHASFVEHVQDIRHPVVVELDAAGFQEQVLGSEDVWMVDFFAPWCGHCQLLAPHYRRAAKLVRGAVKFGTVNCDAHQATCSQQGVRGYPSVRAYFQQGKDRVHAPFRGQRFAEGIARFALARLPSRVVALSQASFAGLVTRGDNRWLIDFHAPGWCGPCRAFEPKFNQLANRLSDEPRLKFGKVDCDHNPRLCQDLNVPHYPYVILFTGQEKLPTTSLDAEEIMAWALPLLRQQQAGHDEL